MVNIANLLVRVEQSTASVEVGLMGCQRSGVQSYPHLLHHRVGVIRQGRNHWLGRPAQQSAISCKLLLRVRSTPPPDRCGGVGESTLRSLELLGDSCLGVKLVRDERVATLDAAVSTQHPHEFFAVVGEIPAQGDVLVLDQFGLGNLEERVTNAVHFSLLCCGVDDNNYFRMRPRLDNALTQLWHIHPRMVRVYSSILVPLQLTHWCICNLRAG